MSFQWHCSLHQSAPNRVHELEDKLASSMMGEIEEDDDPYAMPMGSSGSDDKQMKAEIRKLTQQLEQSQVACRCCCFFVERLC